MTRTQKLVGVGVAVVAGLAIAATCSGPNDLQCKDLPDTQTQQQCLDQDRSAGAAGGATAGYFYGGRFYYGPTAESMRGRFGGFGGSSRGGFGD